MSEYCSPNEREHRIQRWTPTGRYQSVSGRFLGSWTMKQSVATRALLHTTKEFSYVNGNADELPIFQSHGVPADALVEGISPEVGDLRSFISRHVSVGITKFNINEPIEGHRGGYGADFVFRVSNIVQEYGGRLFVSEYHHHVCNGWHFHNPTGWTIEVARNGSPALRGGSHTKWDYYPIIGTIDPRTRWTELHNFLSPLGRFNHGWIQMTHYVLGSEEWTPLDKLEFQFGHANNLGSVNTIFNWSMRGSEFSMSRVDFYLNVAVRYGWARREEMLIEEIYCCPPDIIEPTVPPCILAATIDTGQQRWV